MMIKCVMLPFGGIYSRLASPNSQGKVLSLTGKHYEQVNREGARRGGELHINSVWSCPHCYCKSKNINTSVSGVQRETCQAISEEEKGEERKEEEE
ncbi:UNVERIFIED_CONTAM: hypothetical protein FKN15_040042 [Acipenser sinensis]